jgi:hypothetical protein
MIIEINGIKIETERHICSPVCTEHPNEKSLEAPLDSIGNELQQ